MHLDLLHEPVPEFSCAAVKSSRNAGLVTTIWLRSWLAWHWCQKGGPGHEADPYLSLVILEIGGFKKNKIACITSVIFRVLLASGKRARSARHARVWRSLLASQLPSLVWKTRKRKTPVMQAKKKNTKCSLWPSFRWVGVRYVLPLPPPSALNSFTSNLRICIALLCNQFNI